MTETPPLARARRGLSGTGLCLSGGGYRAMLFHAGVLARLNAAGALGTLDRVSAVSGGSITAGTLAVAWEELRFDDDGVAENFSELVLEPIRKLASRRLDVGAVLLGAVAPRLTASAIAARAFDRHLFGGRSLQDLPDTPRFVFNATNLATGVLLRFSKPYIAEYLVGMVPHPTVPISQAVAASAAFPPFFSPATLRIPVEDWVSQKGNKHTEEPFRNEVRLTDGGVYDNLAVETVWKRHKTVYVSDAGKALPVRSRPRWDWAFGTYRVLTVIDNQVRAQRKRALVKGFNDEADEHEGFLVSIGTPLESYSSAAHVGGGSAIHSPKRPTDRVDESVVERLAAYPTRLTRVPDDVAEQLVNWGFIATDAAMRNFSDPDLPEAPLPYPQRSMRR